MNDHDFDLAREIRRAEANRRMVQRLAREARDRQISAAIITWTIGCAVALILLVGILV